MRMYGSMTSQTLGMCSGQEFGNRIIVVDGEIIDLFGKNVEGYSDVVADSVYDFTPRGEDSGRS